MAIRDDEAAAEYSHNNGTLLQSNGRAHVLLGSRDIHLEVAVYYVQRCVTSRRPRAKKTRKFKIANCQNKKRERKSNNNKKKVRPPLCHVRIPFKEEHIEYEQKKRGIRIEDGLSNRINGPHGINKVKARRSAI